MQREIKFRAWDTINKEMYLPEHDYYIGFDGQVYGMYDGDKEEARIYNAGGEKPILMRFTGEKDKNGVDVYEDDIAQVSVTDSDGKVSGKEYRVIEYKRGSFLPVSYLNSEYLEVVGNIHEHPHLLNSDSNSEPD